MNKANHLLTTIIKDTLDRNPQEALDALNQCLVQNNVELRETEEGVYLAYFTNGDYVISTDSVNIIKEVQGQPKKKRKRTIEDCNEKRKEKGGKEVTSTADNCEIIETSQIIDSNEYNGSVDDSEVIDSTKDDNPPPMNIASSVWKNMDQNTKTSLMTFFRKTKEERIILAERRIEDIKTLSYTISLLNPTGETIENDMKIIASSLNVLNESSRILTIKKSLTCLYIATVYTAIVDANQDMPLKKAKELVCAMCQIDSWKHIARGLRFISLLRISPVIVFYPEIASSHLLEKASKESYQAAVLCLKEVHRDLLPAHHQVPLINLKQETQVLPQKLRQIAMKMTKADINRTLLEKQKLSSK